MAVRSFRVPCFSEGIMIGKMLAHLKKYRLHLSAFLLLSIGLLAFIGLYHPKPSIPSHLARMGGDFALESADGVVHLSDFKGDVVLVYFGYTHCPDACPTALGLMAQAIGKLDPSAQQRVHGLFVSLDPRRDTPALMKEYVHFFDGNFIGVTGDAESLEAIARRWRVAYDIPDKPADSSYNVEHSTFIYLVNPEGKIAALYGDNTSTDQIIHDIRAWL